MWQIHSLTKRESEGRQTKALTEGQNDGDPAITNPALLHCSSSHQENECQANMGQNFRTQKDLLVALDCNEASAVLNAHGYSRG